MAGTSLKSFVRRKTARQRGGSLEFSEAAGEHQHAEAAGHGGGVESALEGRAKRVKTASSDNGASIDEGAYSTSPRNRNRHF